MPLALHHRLKELPALMITAQGMPLVLVRRALLLHTAANNIMPRRAVLFAKRLMQTTVATAVLPKRLMAV